MTKQVGGRPPPPRERRELGESVSLQRRSTQARLGASCCSHRGHRRPGRQGRTEFPPDPQGGWVWGSRVSLGWFWHCGKGGLWEKMGEVKNRELVAVLFFFWCVWAWEKDF